MVMPAETKCGGNIAGKRERARPECFEAPLPADPASQLPRNSVGAVLLVAAALKAWQVIHSPALPLGPQGIPGFEPALIGLELFLGLWLTSGASPNAARRAAIGCFSLFACYTLYEALAGNTDCGCFGQVHVNPWFTFVIDAAVVLTLLSVAKPGGKDAVGARWSRRKWPVAAALLIGLLAGVGSAVLHPKAVETVNGLTTANGGKLVILNPHRWLGHRLPVLNYIVGQNDGAALGNRIASGNWVVMFYHAGCGECRRTVPVYEQLAQREVISGRRAHVAFVRVPSGSGASPRGLFHSSLPMHAALDASHQWFARTPIVVELHNGVVRAEAVGRRAMNSAWLVPR